MPEPRKRHIGHTPFLDVVSGFIWKGVMAFLELADLGYNEGSEIPIFASR